MKNHTENKGSKCVIGFDIWGTLLDLDRVLEAIGKSLALDLGINYEQAIRKIFEIHNEARRIRRLNPDIKPSQLIEAASQAATNVFNTSISAINNAISHTFENIGDEVLFSDTLPSLMNLQSNNIELGVVGNVLFWSSVYTRILIDRLGLSKYFKAMIFSDELEVSKPDRKIFLEFCKLMGVEPGNLIYVGDNVIEDIGGALSTGGIGVLIRRNSGELIILKDMRVASISNLLDLVKIYNVLCN
ncbi:MAG: HAD family hydrolase [Desulfurococcaceae archaeon]